MKLFLKAAILLFMSLWSGHIYAASITIDQKSATVWLPTQTITGKVTGITAPDLTVYCNSVAYTATITGNKTFSIAITLNNTNNTISATCKQSGSTITSNSINLTLGYHPLPAIKPYAVISGSTATLKSTVIFKPQSDTLKYFWSAAANNPAACTLSHPNASSTAVTVPNKTGTYYFNLLVTSGTDSARFQTYIVRSADSLKAYDMTTDHAAWIDSAVIYEVNMSIFVNHATYQDVTNKLAEIKKLGVNTLWLQPVYGTDDYDGQGYSVTDYFNLRTDLGTQQQFDNLIATAKQLHFRVMFDFVPNHTSIAHPYAKDCLKNGDSSHFYTFYQHKNDGKPYSSYYNIASNGLVDYFYNKLVNLDYNNPEVQSWMTQAIEYWMLKYNLDGYRFDTMWGVNSRNPDFGAKLNTALKSIKPDILLLAEEKSCDKIVYKNGFDAAYDWSSDTTWISQWAWAVDYNATKSLSIFNYSDVSQRSSLLNNAIFQNSSLTNRSLRYIENNDQPRFIGNHTLAQTKMAGALIFALPGLPMIYSGQEIGCTGVPNTTKPIFTKNLTIEQSDTLGLFPYYQKVIGLRSAYPALSSFSITKLPLVNSPDMLALHRSKGSQHIIVIMNLAGSAANTTINSANAQFLKNMGNLHDLLSNTDYPINTDSSASIQIPMGANSIRWLLAEPKQTLDETMVVAENDLVKVHSAVTPNGDGINDVLIIDGIESYPKNKLSIMSSNGTMVFQATGYNNSTIVFNGHSGITGAMVRQGTFFYILQYIDNGQQKSKTGYFVLKY